MGLSALPLPFFEVMLRYCEAVHSRNVAYISHRNSAELDQPFASDKPIYTLGNSLRRLITHQNNHHCQIDYIRGLQDQAWNVPVGTRVMVNQRLALPTIVLNTNTNPILFLKRWPYHRTSLTRLPERKTRSTPLHICLSMNELQSRRAYL